jgi:hypothetical protein
VTVAAKDDSPKAFVERSLGPFAAFAAFAGIVVAALTNWDKLASLYAGDPIRVGSVLASAVCLVSLAVVQLYRRWLGRRRALIVRGFIVALVAGSYFLVVLYPNWCAIWGGCPPANWRPIHMPTPIAPAHATDDPGPLEVLQVTVDALDPHLFYMKTICRFTPSASR